MEYRVFFDNTKITSYVQDTNDTITYPADGIRFVRGTLAEVLDELIKNGINPSKLWKDGLISVLLPGSENPLQDISDHPSPPDGYSVVHRKAFAIGLGVVYYSDPDDKKFRYSIVVKHYDNQGNYIAAINDEFVSTEVDNSIQVDGVGEYDYFVAALNQGANLFDIQNQRIGIMDSNGWFGSSLYN